MMQHGESLNHETYMQLAIREAVAALEHDDVPVGAVVVHDGQVIGRGHNQRELLKDPSAHAEMVAITAASAYLHSWRLDRCALYVTLEPCPMCAGAMILARLPMLVYGAEDPKGGGCGSVYNLVEDGRLNHRVEVVRGVMANDCAVLLQEFFRRQRKLGKK